MRGELRRLVFFANSGAEAMECAIKMARKYQSASGQPERYRIITFEGAFHGRTLATLAAGGQKKYLDGFGPVVDGFDQVPFGDLEAAKRAIGPETAAILIEPIRARAACAWCRRSSCARCAQLCDEHGLLLVFDEVQTGIGRTGELFAYQQSGVTPDIMALAKALRRRLPDRRLPRHRRSRQGHDRRHPRLDLRRQSAGDGGGQRRARRGAGRGFLDRVRRIALLLKQRLAEIKDRHPAVIAEVRGEGLLIGLRAWCRAASWSTRCAPRRCSRSRPATMWCGCCRR